MILPITKEKLTFKCEKANSSPEHLSQKKFKTVYRETKIKKPESDKEEQTPTIAPMTPVALLSHSSPLLALSKIEGIQEIETAWHQIVESMTHLDNAGIQETTLVLQSSKESILSGTEITILEYNTAPKDFNIQIKGSPEAVQLFTKHLGELVAAFNSEYRPFKVNRLDLYLNKKEAIARKKRIISETKELTQDDGSALSLG